MIIALCGLAGSGKTTAADILVHDFNFARRPFAHGLKAMISAGFGIAGEVLDGPREVKELPLEIFGGKSLRYVMQTLGTEWGREMIHPDLWVNSWRHGAAGLPRVVVDDARFTNELECVRSMGGTIIMLKRNGAGSSVSPEHASERPHLLKPDITYDNNADLAVLRAWIGLQVAILRSKEREEAA